MLSESNDTWLLKLHDAVKITEVLLTESIGCELEMVAEIMTESIHVLRLESVDLPDWRQHNQEVEEYIVTRRMRRKNAIENAKEVSLTSQPKAGVRRLNKTSSKVVVDKALKIKGANAPEDEKLESFNSVILAPITAWIGSQLLNQKLPKSVKAQIITLHEKYPDGLMAVPSAKQGGSPRIIVPVNIQKDLVMQAHQDIHHQNHSKVYKLWSPLYYWPAMFKDIEDYCKACKHCLSGKMRREKLQS